jgi:metal-responsive CopG/Arc/MetJ family transcriptional regulator
MPTTAKKPKPLTDPNALVMATGLGLPQWMLDALDEEAEQEYMARAALLRRILRDRYYAKRPKGAR